MIDSILTYILIILSTFSTTLLLAFFFLNRKQPEEHTPHREGYWEEDRETDPLLTEAEGRADSIIRQAVKKAKQVVVKAELEGISLTNKFKSLEERVEAEYQNELNQVIKEFRAKIGQDVNRAEVAYQEFLTGISQKMTAAVNAKEKTVDTQIVDFFVQIERSLKDYTQDLQKKGSQIQMPLEEIRADLQRRMNEAAAKYEEKLSQIGYAVEQGQKQYENKLALLETSLSQSVKKGEASLNQNIREFFDRSEEVIKRFVGDLSGQTQLQVEKEIGAVKDLVDEYRRQRLEIIDESIVAILEKTLNIALGKKLTLGDQTKLVYEALEQAKKDNFFA